MREEINLAKGSVAEGLFVYSQGHYVSFPADAVAAGTH